MSSAIAVIRMSRMMHAPSNLSRIPIYAFIQFGSILIESPSKQKCSIVNFEIGINLVETMFDFCRWFSANRPI